MNFHVLARVERQQAGEVRELTAATRDFHTAAKERESFSVQLAFRGPMVERWVVARQALLEATEQAVLSAVGGDRTWVQGAIDYVSQCAYFVLTALISKEIPLPTGALRGQELLAGGLPSQETQFKAMAEAVAAVPGNYARVKFGLWGAPGGGSQQWNVRGAGTLEMAWGTFVQSVQRG